MNSPMDNIVSVQAELVVVDSLSNGLFSTVQHSFKTVWKSESATVRLMILRVSTKGPGTLGTGMGVVLSWWTP